MILGIETSCDETAVALLEENGKALVSLVSSQIDLHTRYGGVVPELASRRHLEMLVPLIEEAFGRVDSGWIEVKAIAVTQGPGLVGALLVGLEFAKAVAIAYGLPLLGVNHLAGHVYATFLEFPQKLPAIALIVSGGHTELVLLDELERFHSLGTTRDDAAGETLDKIARFLGLPYPGGPEIQCLALQGNPAFHRFPVGELDNPLDFSFSGLKTAVLYFAEAWRKESRSLPLADLAASFQEAIVHALIRKTERAIDQTGVRQLIVCGGVAANHRLRQRMQELADRRNVALQVPSPGLCTDNALMIARAGLANLQKGRFLSLREDADPNLSLFRLD
jgi:N6-L-threonylcarbamoyladenine synthase